MGVPPQIYGDRYTLAMEIDDILMASKIRNNSIIKIADDLSRFWQTENHKIMYHCPDKQTTEKLEEYARSIENERFHAFRTGDTLLEFQDPHISKGNALKIYCENNFIDLKDVIAFGDAENDIEMLETAGTGVCLQNGQDSVKKIADMITDHDVKNDGVGRFLLEYVI